MEVLFVEERDPAASPIQAKGVGELGICGAGAAIANAIYNATAACGCEAFRSRPDKVMAGLADGLAKCTRTLISTAQEASGT